MLYLQDPSPATEQAQHLEAAQLEDLFKAGRQALKAGEPASAFTCPLTMEVFRDPVMTPSGLSYERSALLEHLKKVGLVACALHLSSFSKDRRELGHGQILNPASRPCPVVFFASYKSAVDFYRLCTALASRALEKGMWPCTCPVTTCYVTVLPCPPGPSSPPPPKMLLRHQMACHKQ